eukprot:GSMAST32.ASY1.ANO1.1574.1 assembled CDS
MTTLFVVAFTIPVFFMVKRLVYEKESRIREGMKMMGLFPSSVAVSWIASYMKRFTFHSVICAILLTKDVIDGLFDVPILMMFFLFFGFFVGFIPTFAVKPTWSVSLKALSIDYCKLVNENYSMGLAMQMLYIGAGIWVVLGMYLSRILPSEFGIRSPPWFCLLPSFYSKCSSSVTPVDQSKSQDLLLYGDQTYTDTENFERLSKQQEALLHRNDCVHVRGLTKQFQTADGSIKVATDNLHAAFFKGEIFVLLGHNGAGKTTTISQLCGLIAPSSGDATIFGLSIRNQMTEIRKLMGICPQMNVLYDELTVNEHLQLYANIKLEVLDGVALTEKTHAKTSNLSGGQKRKACLAIALIGNSPVLMLDEPTSGMDVFAQRSTWNMLQKSKQGRIILLTTHSMEEADVLADRIGIMSEGRMICCGTPMFLKQRYGVGYSMILLSNFGQELSFQLPLGASHSFEALFTELEQLKAKDPNKLETFNVSVTTVEEVFIKSAQGAHRKQASVSKSKDTGIVAKEEKYNDDVKIDNNETNTKHEINGAKKKLIKKRSTSSSFSLGLHILAMLMKRFYWFIRDMKSILFMVVLPLLLVTLGLAITPSTGAYNPRSSLFPNAYGSHYVDSSTSFTDLITKYSGEICSSSLYGDQEGGGDDNNWTTDVLPDDNFYNLLLMTNSTATFGVPLFQSILSSSFWKMFDPGNAGTIDVTLHPLPLTIKLEDEQKANLTFVVVFLIGLAFSFIPAPVIEFIVRERSLGFKHQQLVSGVSLTAYWFTAWLWDVLLYMIPAWGTILIFNIWDEDLTAYTTTADDNWDATRLAILFTAVTVTISIGVMSIVLCIKFVSFLPQFALPSAFFSLALKGFLASQYHQCLVCPRDLYHADLPLNCRESPVSGMDEAVAWPEIRGMLLGAILFPLLAFTIDIVLSLPSIQRFLCSCMEPNIVDAPFHGEDADVINERNPRGLRKVFRSKNKDGKRFKKVAVKDMWFGIKRGEVFGFLGTNGAGKTTVFRMLSGDHLPTVGTAAMGGRDILSEQIAVRRLIGYCPQHNALLPKVTVRQHLRIFGMIKGVQGDSLNMEIEEKIKKMDLVEFADKSAGSLSGGNKRKLCVAIALIGAPPIIFLDEPSAGMDPVAKRFMWSLISEISTQNREATIILTTHSMEECSALCTRIGIMVDGRLRCIGSEQHLKDRYGHGYQLEVRVAPGSREKRNIKTNTTGNIDGAQSATDLKIPSNQLLNACQQLGNAARYESFNVLDNLLAWCKQNISPDAVLVEQHGNSLRLSLPFSEDVDNGSMGVGNNGGSNNVGSIGNNGGSNNGVFGLLERNKDALGLSEYCVGQTTLEQIFLGFAKEQQGVDASQIKGVAAVIDS